MTAAVKTGTLSERLAAFVSLVDADLSIVRRREGTRQYVLVLSWDADADSKNVVTGRDDDLDEAITQALEEAGC